MQSNTAPTVKDLVLIGGGHSHIIVLKRFGMRPIAGVRITLITRDVHTPYSGMLPGYIAGHYRYDEAHIDLRPLTIFAGARLFHSTVQHIDFDNNEVHCEGRPPVKYDALSINIGSRPGVSGVDGAQQFTLPIKPIDHFLVGWKKIVARVKRADGAFNLCIVGTGAGGVEMSLATQYRLQQMLGNDAAQRLKVTLIGAQQEILQTHNAQVRKKFMRVLRQRGIHLVTGKPVERVTHNQVICGDTVIDSDATLWVTSASAQPWLSESGLAVDAAGFIKVNDCLQSLDRKNVFAAGDIAAVVDHPREKSGVFAVRQGTPLSNNLRRFLLGKPLQSFAPQKSFLSLISTGNRYVIASRSRWSLEGAWLWRVKNWIDRRFVKKFSDLPEMQKDAAPAVNAQLADSQAIKELSVIAMRCGGCGAKVGSSILSRVINRLQTVSHEDVLVGLDSPDDAAVLRVPAGKVMVQSIDYFRAFIDDAYIFGQIAANHALGDVFAMGAEAQSALAIATLPYGREHIVEDQLFQVMSGALSVLNTCHTALVGGHSSEGAELAFGLTVNGIADPDNLLHKGGMQAGQVIILSKPIGTGTILAADMRGKAKGRWLYATIDNMLLSNRTAAAILLEHGASACTDVTGFGLLGHLLEMVRLSGVDIELQTTALPLLDGAVDCIEQGIFSSLQPQNIRLRRAVRDNGFDRQSPIYSLLFDPQTAGGLLASVPASQAAACVEQLRQAGYNDSAIIGSVNRPEPDGALEPITLV